MNAANELEAIEVTRARVEAVERRRPWLLREVELAEERGRSRVDLFFSRVGRYMEQSHEETFDLS